MDCFGRTYTYARSKMETAVFAGIVALEEHVSCRTLLDPLILIISFRDFMIASAVDKSYHPLLSLCSNAEYSGNEFGRLCSTGRTETVLCLPSRKRIGIS